MPSHIIYYVGINYNNRKICGCRDRVWWGMVKTDQITQNKNKRNTFAYRKYINMKISVWFLAYGYKRIIIGFYHHHHQHRCHRRRRWLCYRRCAVIIFINKKSCVSNEPMCVCKIKKKKKQHRICNTILIFDFCVHFVVFQVFYLLFELLFVVIV